MYDYERETGYRHNALEPDLSVLENDQERRRFNHYRSGVAERWGVANWREYEGRYDHEQRMRRLEEERVAEKAPEPK